MDNSLIKRQDAIDALKEKVFHNLSDEFYGTMQVLEELPSAQPEQQWIPCSERLPKEDGYYLVTRKNPKGHVTRVRFKNGDGLFYPMWGNGDCDILAWMPLPDAYEEDK